MYGPSPPAPWPPALVRLTWWFVLAIAALMVMAAAMVAGVLIFILVPAVRSPMSQGAWRLLAFPGVMLAVLSAPMFWAIRRVLRGQRRIKRAVRAAEGRACIHCVHDLNGLGHSGMCPGCGRSFDAAAAQRSWARVHMHK